MNGLLEKLKALDKKVWILVGVAAVVVIAVTVGLVIGLGGSESNTQEDTEVQGGAVTGGTTTADDRTTAGSTTTTDGATTASTTGTTDQTTTSASDAAQTNTTASSSAAIDQTQANSSAATQNQTTQTPTLPSAVNPEGDEILGAGSKDQPYLEYPGDDMSVTTVSIPAGKSLHYGIYRIGGMILTIDNANAYVVYNGTRYNASGGRVSFEVGSALASDAVEFEIGNAGSSAASFKIRFSNPTGSYMNPVVLSNISSQNKVSLPEGSDTGYYYKYIAEKSGLLRLYMTASTDSVLLATNNRNSAQRTTEADALTDEQGNTYIELDVNAGDEILINVGAKPNKRGKYPAVDITWNGKYAN